MIKLYSEGDSYKLYHGSMLEMESVIPSGSIDAIITDPPYELNFMNKGWDNSGIAFQKGTWEKCYSVLKSGGHLLAFGGSRTFHRIACAIEDAGFEIRDIILWLYGSGFPKSMNIGLAIDKRNGVESKVVGRKKGAGSTGTNKAGNQTFVAKNQYEDGTHDIKEASNEWAGWGTALKPAYEPIIIARKPCEKTTVDNVLKYGVGGININECRVVENVGRFPSNVILTYDEEDVKEVCGGFPYTVNNDDDGYIAPSDSGSAARYYYCAKASIKDRDEGLDAFEKKQITDGYIRTNKVTAGAYNANPAEKRNIHPTVKPVELMQYLIRLVSPKGATILDCFNGSGSTGKAVMYENGERDANYKYIGVELTEEYLPISKARIEYARRKALQTRLF